MLVGFDHLERVDVDRAAAGPGQRRGENLRRHALAARDQAIAGARLEVVEQADGGAELAVLAGRDVDRRQQLAARRAARQQRAHHVAVAAEEGRRQPRDLVAAPCEGLAGAFEQQVGDAGERRRHDDQRPRVSGDERRGLLDLFGGGERRAAELPDFERLAAAGAGGSARHVTGFPPAPAGGRAPGAPGRSRRAAPPADSRAAE